MYIYIHTHTHTHIVHFEFISLTLYIYIYIHTLFISVHIFIIIFVFVIKISYLFNTLYICCTFFTDIIKGSMLYMYISKIHKLINSKCGELSKYTDSAQIQVGDLSSRYMNESDVYDRCGHDTRQFHPSCTACRRTANLPGLA